jgi:hypothetical protein
MACSANDTTVDVLVEEGLLVVMVRAIVFRLFSYPPLFRFRSILKDDEQNSTSQQFFWGWYV